MGFFRKGVPNYKLTVLTMLTIVLFCALNKFISVATTNEIKVHQTKPEIEHTTFGEQAKFSTTTEEQVTVSMDDILKFFPKSKLHDLPLSTLPNPYHITNAHLCTSLRNIDIVFLVSSATRNVVMRNRIRETWGNSAFYNQSIVRTVFVLGSPGNNVIQQHIESENELHGDIVQGKWLDTYHNITHKTVLSIRWASEHCLHSKLVVKVDDDVFVNVFKLLIDSKHFYSTKSRTMWCWAIPENKGYIQRTKGKWAVGFDYFNGISNFPFLYCHGFFVVMTPDLLRSVYEISRQTPYFRLDDVYLTGIIPTLARDIKVKSLRDSLTYTPRKTMDCFLKLSRNCEIVAATQFGTGFLRTVWLTVLKIWKW